MSLEGHVHAGLPIGTCRTHDFCRRGISTVKVPAFCSSVSRVVVVFSFTLLVALYTLINCSFSEAVCSFLPGTRQNLWCSRKDSSYTEARYFHRGRIVPTEAGFLKACANLHF